jgi:voltage-gated potassium channel
VTWPVVGRKRPSLRQRLHRLFQRPGTEIVIGGLIIASVGLAIVEVSVGPLSPHRRLLERVNNILLGVFAVELLLRYVAAPSKRRFWSEFWLDSFAVFVSLATVSLSGALNPLRLIRLLRLVGLLARVAGLYHYVIRRAGLELVIASGLILLTVVSGSAALLAFERGAAAGPQSYSEAFWASLYSLFAGEPIPASPATLGGKIIIVLIMFMGMSTFAMFTGTVSAYMVNRLRAHGDFFDVDELKEHLIICGFSRKAEIIAREWAAKRGEDAPPVVIVADVDGEPELQDPSLRPLVRFITDDFTRVSALEKAGVRAAGTCVILSDTSRSRSEHDADARTILTALTVERLNAAIYTCAELNNPEYSPHLKMANVNDFVVTGEHNAYLLAQATLNCGVTAVFSELLTHQRGNSFYRIAVPAAWMGRTFIELLVHLKEKHDALLVAVRGASGEVVVNPRSHTFQGGDEIVVIATHELEV